LARQPLAAVAALLLFAQGAAAAPAPPTMTEPLRQVISADACLDDEEVNFLALVNEYRASAGLGPVAASASLSSAAAYHSIDMAANGYLDHTLLDGTSVEQNMANFGYDGATHGETIAAGAASAPEVLQTWQGSAEHNAILLGGGYGAIGIGRAYDAAAPYGWYWTAIFGDISDGPGWVCGEAAPPSKSVSLFQSVAGGMSTSDVNLRSGPGTDYTLVTTVPAGTSMTVTGRQMQGFLPVKVDGQYGWVGAEWVELGAVTLEQTATAPSAASEPGTATAVSAVELIDAPFDGAAPLLTIPGVAVVTLTGEAQDGFLGVIYQGQQGWANASYLEVAEIAPGTTLLQTAAPPTTEDLTKTEMAPAPTLDGSPGAEAIATVNVNLRSQPSPTAPILSVVPAGTAVSLTGSQANGYANVRFNGEAGWIDTAYLQ
jgi:uncharacterized protein YkwD/uncharacterized protein YraI